MVANQSLCHTWEAVPLAPFCWRRGFAGDPLLMWERGPAGARGPPQADPRGSAASALRAEPDSRVPVFLDFR